MGLFKGKEKIALQLELRKIVFTHEPLRNCFGLYSVAIAVSLVDAINSKTFAEICGRMNSFEIVAKFFNVGFSGAVFETRSKYSFVFISVTLDSLNIDIN